MKPFWIYMNYKYSHLLNHAIFTHIMLMLKLKNKWTHTRLSPKKSIGFAQPWDNPLHSKSRWATLWGTWNRKMSLLRPLPTPELGVPQIGTAGVLPTPWLRSPLAVSSSPLGGQPEPTASCRSFKLSFSAIRCALLRGWVEGAAPYGGMSRSAPTAIW